MLPHHSVLSYSSSGVQLDCSTEWLRPPVCKKFCNGAAGALQVLCAYIQ